MEVAGKLEETIRSNMSRTDDGGEDNQGSTGAIRVDGPVEEAAKIASPQQMFKQEKHSPRPARGNGYGDRRYAPRKCYGCGQEGHYK